MQFLNVLCLFASLAVAITNDELAAKIPQCARGCLEDGYKALGCGHTDYKCQCDNTHEIFKLALPCLDAKCTTYKEKDQMAASTTILCASVAQQANPNWTGPSIADHLPPSLLSRSVKRSNAAGQIAAGVGFVGAAALFALAL